MLLESAGVFPELARTGDTGLRFRMEFNSVDVAGIRCLRAQQGTDSLGAARMLLPDRTQVLEIGSGTGQHAVHFAATCRICPGIPPSS